MRRVRRTLSRAPQRQSHPQTAGQCGVGSAKGGRYGLNAAGDRQLQTHAQASDKGAIKISGAAIPRDAMLGINKRRRGGNAAIVPVFGHRWEIGRRNRLPHHTECSHSQFFSENVETPEPAESRLQPGLAAPQLTACGFLPGAFSDSRHTPSSTRGLSASHRFRSTYTYPFRTSSESTHRVCEPRRRCRRFAAPVAEG